MAGGSGSCSCSLIGRQKASLYYYLITYTILMHSLDSVSEKVFYIGNDVRIITHFYGILFLICLCIHLVNINNVLSPLWTGSRRDYKPYLIIKNPYLSFLVYIFELDNTFVTSHVLPVSSRFTICFHLICPTKKSNDLFVIKGFYASKMYLSQ